MRKLFWTIFCAVCAVTAASGKVYWVSPSGYTFPGWQGVATADKSFTTIKAALADSDLADGDTVVLDKCTFDLSYDNRANEINGEVTISKSITVSGVGTRDETVLNGGREYSGRYWAGQTILRHSPRFTFAANNVTFQNMTFEKMGSDGSAAILGNNTVTGSVVSNMTFRNTGAGYETWYNNFTAHVNLRGGGAHVSCCVFTNNVFPCAVLEMTGTSGDMSLENCYFANNTCDGSKNDNGVVHSGFGVYEGKGLCRNNTIVNNKSKSGALKYSNWGKNRVVNNIIYGNKDLDGNEDKNFFGDGSSYSKLWTYNCLGAGTWTPDTAKGNIFANPNLDSDGMHLKTGSLCIGAADKTYATAYDIDGVARDPDEPCMGCSEFVGSVDFTCAISTPESPDVSQPDKFTLTVTTAGAPVAPFSYAWDLNGDGVADTNAAEVVLFEVGEYTVSVLVTDADGMQAAAALDGKLTIYPADKVFYVTTSNPNARAPFASWETAATSINAAHAHALKFADSKIVLGDGDHPVTATMTLTNGMTVTSLNGRDQTKLTRPNLYGDKSMFVMTDPNAVLESVTLCGMGPSKVLWAQGTAVNMTAGILRDCVITNFCGKNNGAVKATAAKADRPVRIDRCVIAYNTDGIAEPVAAYLNGYVTLENCLIAHNIGSCSGSTVLRTESTVAVVRNCTFADNHAVDMLPVTFASLTPKVAENLIVSGCTTNGRASVADDVMIYNVNTKAYTTPVSSLRYSCLDSATEDYSGLPCILTADPKFAGADDYRLTTLSPCRNAGTNDNVFTAESLDLDGKARLVGKRIDMGCYECHVLSGMNLYVR